MFGRSTPPDQKNAGQPQPQSQQHVQPGPAVAPQQPAAVRPPVANSAASAAGSVIGADLAIIGHKITVVSQGRVQIDGTIEGNVAGREVIVGETGQVTGTVTANAVEIRGGLHGAINAAAVSLLHSSKVEGDINHQTLTIAEGAQFDGRVRRPENAASLEPNLDVDSVIAATKG